jgi:hypothetical protein
MNLHGKFDSYEDLDYDFGKDINPDQWTGFRIK